jgi:putative lipoic acid-binding regulatory protein
MVRCLPVDLKREFPVSGSPGDESPLVFPCDFPIKAMGEAAPDFDSLVVSLVRRHCPDLLEGAVSVRLSSGGRYMSVTVRINARNRAQLDDIYHELTAHERVLVAL